MIEPNARLSRVRQCQLLGVSRSSVYYQPRAVGEEQLRLMRLIDEQYLRTPFYGSRNMTTHLRRLGYRINRKRVRRLMRQMGLRSIAPRPGTSEAHPAHPVYPYRLRDLTIDRPDQVWASDITYVPMARGFLYLVAILDWHTRKVLAWRLSNTLDSRACVEALEEALACYGCPEIVNTDQGAQFTSTAFISVLQAHDIRISMDGKGCYRDNIFVERLWRSVKYECLYLQAFDDGHAVHRELKRYFHWYNTERPHQGLDNQTPDELYYQHWQQVA